MASFFTILIAEDQAELRGLVARALAENGFRVIAAADGYEAVRLLADEPVDLLYADIVMPGLDGVQLAKQAKLIRPGIKVLLATGYAQQAAERDAARQGRLLLKPVRQADLIREVDALLGAGG